jgi:hypothetical protein
MATIRVKAPTDCARCDYLLPCGLGTLATVQTCQSDQWKLSTDDMSWKSRLERHLGSKGDHYAINVPSTEVARGSPVVFSVKRVAVHHHFLTTTEETYEQMMPFDISKQWLVLLTCVSADHHVLVYLLTLDVMEHKKLSTSGISLWYNSGKNITIIARCFYLLDSIDFHCLFQTDL